jgi:hypothetical protein
MARVSWKDIDLIPSVEDAWLFFKVLSSPFAISIRTDIALGSLQT